ncbi:sensor histidine kinase [Bacillus xiapuensis]|uniref:sensor histidine kinase n=1 Tax=Bacillus xiapuensis TaxID=2014075 RepID=UPI000C248F83|nr:HAMP domain-containing sensor histidine kinase [Bacillus xiapuensis]
MKWKLTAQFLLAMIITIILSLFVFMLLNTALFLMDGHKDKLKSTPESYTIAFGKNIGYQKGRFLIPSDKLAELKREQKWIQILDENGREVYSYNQPKEIPNHYTPGELVFFYKYGGAAAGDSTIFVAKLDKGNRKFSYIIGYPYEEVSKGPMIYHGTKWWTDAVKLFLLAVCTIILIASLIGYLISRRLTKPILSVTESIREFAKGNFTHTVQEKGLYKNVFHNLNELSLTLLANEKERKKTERLREEWVANITHDIKTPLASVKGYSEILVDPQYQLQEKEQKEYLEIISQKAEYISRLVDDLNMTYKLRHSADIVHKKEGNIVAILQETVIDILNHPRYENVPIEFSADAEQYLFPLDEMLWKRAFTNLLFNAIVHNPEGTIIHVRFKGKQRKRPIIEISDNGRGIDETELENLFTRYYCGTNTGEAHKGSGLGLAIAKQVAESHGAEMKAESSIGQGTTITIILAQPVNK